MHSAIRQGARALVATLNIDDNATRTQLLTYVLIGFAVLIALALIGWSRRRRRQRSIPDTAPMPADVGKLIAEFEGFYVSTTLEGQPLNRVAVRGLAFRSRATIAVVESGLILGLPGDNKFIPGADIREVSTGNYTIDRVVEPDGLVLLAWTLGRGTPDETKLDSYLRVPQTRELVEALRTLAPATSGRAA